MTPEQLADSGIKVKPLVWVDNPTGGIMAAGFHSTYRIKASVSGSIAWQPGHMGLWAVVSTVKVAKAAAEADHIARVCAMLESV